MKILKLIHDLGTSLSKGVAKPVYNIDMIVTNNMLGVRVNVLLNHINWW